MGIYEDIDDLKIQVRKGIDSNDKKQVGELLRQAFALCENIKELIKTSDEDERKNLSNAMQDFRFFLESESKKLSKKMGLSDDQFARFSENPANFSKEQWIGMEAIKGRFAAKTKEIRQVIKQHVPKKEGHSLPPGLPENWKELIEQNQ